MDTHAHHDGEHHDANGDVICPVCRARVNSGTAPSREHDGERWFFCNEKCEQAFVKRPDHYAQRARKERVEEGPDAPH